MAALPDRIVTDRLVLRRPTVDDADAIFAAYAQDADVARYLTWRPHEAIAQTIEYLRRCEEGWLSGRDLTWALTFRGADEREVIGMFGVRPEGFKPNIGYVLARPRWGQGLMTEAGRAVVNELLLDPGVYRVWAICDAANLGSARVLTKLGMTLEGTLRRFIIHPNVSPEPRDALCFSIAR